jgi:hypothetical protein
MCSMSFELSINLTLSLLQTEHLTNGDQWDATDTVTETYVFGG